MMATNNPEIPGWLADMSEFYQHPRFIEGKGWCALSQMLFTWALCVGLDPVGRKYRYCFEHHKDALDSLQNWDGQGDAPGNWIKRKGLGEDLINPNFCKVE
jgi:hypothetical protein